MVTRIIYGLLAGAIAIGFLSFGTPGFIAFIYLLGYMAIFEINKAYKAGGINSVPVVGYAFITFLIPSYLMFGMVGVLVLLTLCMYLNFIYHILKQKVKEDLIYSNIQLIYPCLPIAFACPVLLSTTNPKVGFSVLLTLVCVCIGTDVFAYFAGVLRGKHKLCPEISPKKTIEGSIGGFCGAIVVAIFMHFIVWLILGVVLPVSFLLWEFYVVYLLNLVI